MVSVIIENLLWYITSMNGRLLVMLLLISEILAFAGTSLTNIEYCDGKQRSHFVISTHLEDKAGRGPPSDFDDQALLAAAEGNEERMLDNLNAGRQHQCGPTIVPTIVRRLKKLGKVLKNY
uniref:Uncharacterized protein n=1 Tax=Glossina pallidipes TaxID=7398 RepID=A0A1B0A5D9_GLOPL